MLVRIPCYISIGLERASKDGGLQIKSYTNVEKGKINLADKTLFGAFIIQVAQYFHRQEDTRPYQNINFQNGTTEVGMTC